MCLDVIGKVRRDQEVTPVSLPKSDCVAQARKRSVAKPNRGKAEPLKSSWGRIADEGEVLRALAHEQLLRLRDIGGREEGSNMLLGRSAEFHHIWLTLAALSGGRQREAQSADRRRPAAATPSDGGGVTLIQFGGLKLIHPFVQ